MYFDKLRTVSKLAEDIGLRFAGYTDYHGFLFHSPTNNILYKIFGPNGSGVIPLSQRGDVLLSHIRLDDFLGLEYDSKLAGYLTINPLMSKLSFCESVQATDIHCARK